MKTYRFRGHSRTDPAKYRPEGELERWQERDPIALLGARLAEDGRLDRAERDGCFATRSSSWSTRPPNAPSRRRSRRSRRFADYVYAA